MILEYKITCDVTTGAINITGPIEQQVITVGILEFCKKITMDYKPSLIQPANGLTFPPQGRQS